MAFAGAIATVAILGLTFWFAAQFQSTAQQEAHAKAPPPAPVFAEVEEGTLADEVSFTGQIGPSTQVPVTVLPVPNAALSVVTGHPLAAGVAVTSGQVLTEVNGRPLFGAQSDFSFYRDMGVGDCGPDVAALQRALAAHSYRLTADGRFGAATAAAVARWYEDSGYTTPMRAAQVPSVDSASAPTPPREESGENMPVEDPGNGAQGEPLSPVAPAPSVPEPFVPVAELIALPSESSLVLQGVAVGQHLAVDGRPDIVLGSADQVVTITAPAADVGTLTAGDTGSIDVNGTAVVGILGDIRETGATEPAPDGDAGSGTPPNDTEGVARVTFTVVPQSPLPVATGRARVTVTTQLVAQDALIVPVLAVSDRGADKTVVAKRQNDGTLIEVPVTVRGTLRGEVAVEPKKSGALKVGDDIRVG